MSRKTEKKSRLRPRPWLDWHKFPKKNSYPEGASVLRDEEGDARFAGDTKHGWASHVAPPGKKILDLAQWQKSPGMTGRAASAFDGDAQTLV